MEFKLLDKNRQNAANRQKKSYSSDTTNYAISSWTLWTIFWLLKTSNKLISLTTRLAINPSFKVTFPPTFKL